jgi:hypothetical protein
MLRRMLVDVNEVIEMLWFEVEDLRGQLARMRGSADVPAMYTRPPTQPTDGSVSVEVLTLQVDDASTAADALWFESQWMRSQLASISELRE